MNELYLLRVVRFMILLSHTFLYYLYETSTPPSQYVVIYYDFAFDILSLKLSDLLRESTHLSFNQSYRLILGMG